MINKVKDIFKQLREQISIAEYILWWVVRGCMVVYTINQFKGDHEPIQYALPIINGSSTFLIFLLKLITPKNSMFGRISFKANNFITAIVFFGAFLFQYLKIELSMRSDWVLHFISGFIITFLGYYLLVATDRKRAVLSPEVSACGAMGFSFFIIIAWEIMEFGGDFIFGGTNQDYLMGIDRASILAPILSKGVPGPDQYPVFDTMVDMILAFFATLFSGIAIFAFKRHKEKKSESVVENEVKEAVAV